MIHIIAKGYKYLLTQLSDFFGSVSTIDISLKSAKGRKKYEEVFGRKLDDEKTNIKVRTISINQSRLTEFLSNLSLYQNSLKLLKPGQLPLLQ